MENFQYRDFFAVHHFKYVAQKTTQAESLIRIILTCVEVQGLFTVLIVFVMCLHLQAPTECETYGTRKKKVGRQVKDHAVSVNKALCITA